MPFDKLRVSGLSNPLSVFLHGAASATISLSFSLSEVRRDATHAGEGFYHDALRTYAYRSWEEALVRTRDQLDEVHVGFDTADVVAATAGRAPGDHNPVLVGSAQDAQIRGGESGYIGLVALRYVPRGVDVLVEADDRPEVVGFGRRRHAHCVQQIARPVRGL